MDNKEERERRVSWARELLADCEEAIAAQQRIIEHDGALDGHGLSLRSLQSEKRKLEAELQQLLATPSTDGTAS